MTHAADQVFPTTATFPPDVAQRLVHAMGSKINLREYKNTSLAMPAIRTDMGRLANAAADTFMTYALVGHASPAPWSALASQMKVIAGEYDELQKAVAERDVKELRDGVGDLLYTVLGMAYRAGIPFVSDFEQVVRSNLTKFDLSVSEAEATKAKYDALGIVTYCQPVHFTSGERGDATYYVTFVDGDQVGSDGKTYPDHKWLKSTKFVDIFLQPLASSHPLERTSSKYVEEMFAEAKAMLLPTDGGNADLYRLLVELIAGTLFLDGPRDNDVAVMRDEALPASQAMLSALFQFSTEEAMAFSSSSFDPQAFLSFVQYVTLQHPVPSKAFHDVMTARINQCALGIRSCFMNMNAAMQDDESRRVKLIEALYDAAAPFYGITYGISYDAILQEGGMIENGGKGGQLMDAVKHFFSFLTGV